MWFVGTHWYNLQRKRERKRKEL